MIRTGIGYDVHQLAEGHKLVLAGVEIPFDKGSVGHSDGDALTHAIVDALLGAVALGDIGMFFPSNENKWKGVNSLELLQNAVEKVRDEGFSINNIDGTIILQEPKLQKYIPEIRKNLAATLGILIEQISVKATTTDFLGAIGAGDGWAAQAVVTLSKI